MNLKSRLEKPRKNYIKAGIWCLLYTLFIVWVNNFWWLLLLPLIFDAFVTNFIPYDWWKKYKDTNPIIYTICSWIDAIVFALVAVYFINLYLFQNYQIPTSSLEKTLLVGDFLCVNKAAYGPRVPNTPLSFPLVQHTFPWGGKSYIERPQWSYRRLKGWDKVEKGDIVVFNFPTGDTVCTKMQNPDYYTLCNQYGRDFVHQRKDVFGDIVWRPVDRRENYVKRCVATAGDTLEIRDNVIYINGVAEPKHAGVQLNYFVQATAGNRISDKQMEQLGISKDDRLVINATNLQIAPMLASLGFDITQPIYHFPLTEAAKQQLVSHKNIAKIVVEPAEFGGRVFPLNATYGWTRDNYGPLYVPKKGDTIALNLDNLPIYEHIIRNYEGNTLSVSDSTIYINGQKADMYTTKMDYYWMMGDNRHNSADSRYWGFVPEDHIVGRPMFIWLSLDKDKGWFDGKIRWKRLFTSGE